MLFGFKYYNAIDLYKVFTFSFSNKDKEFLFNTAKTGFNFNIYLFPIFLLISFPITTFKNPYLILQYSSKSKSCLLFIDSLTTETSLINKGFPSSVTSNLFGIILEIPFYIFYIPNPSSSPSFFNKLFNLFINCLAISSDSALFKFYKKKYLKIITFILIKLNSIYN